MSGVCPRPILNNEPVSKRKREGDYAAPESPESLEAPEEDPIMAGKGATAKQIASIIAQVTLAMSRARVGAGATTQYFQNPYGAYINPGTPDGLKLYLKAVEAKEKDEDRFKNFPVKFESGGDLHEGSYSKVWLFRHHEQD